MRVVTAAQMRAIDKRATDDFHIASNILLEHAGLHVAKAAWQLAKGSTRRRVVVFAGKGNNGGDGFVAARHLQTRGLSVRLFTTTDVGELQGDVARAAAAARAVGVDVVEPDDQSERKARLHLAAADVVVDALLGTGGRDKPAGAVAAAVGWINAAGKPVVSVDIPTGVQADTGYVPGAAVRATTTVTFGALKPGLLIGEGREAAGRVIVADIGLPKTLFSDGQLTFVTPEVARSGLPERPARGHKGTFGRLLAIAGSRGMAGAASLCVRGAQRVGAGVVTLASPASLNDVFCGTVPEALTVSLPDDGNGTLHEEAADAVARQLQTADALVIGPGLSTGRGAMAVVERVVHEAACPVVVDADALNVIAADRRLFARIAERSGEAPFVLTPHPGEMARLCGVNVSDVLARPLDLAGETAARWQAVVVLKGAPTVTALPDGNVFINGTGSNALATAGTGDVLAGAIGGLIAQGASPAGAAVAAVFVHGLAGDGAGRKLGNTGVVAGDVAAALPEAMSQVRSDDGGVFVGYGTGATMTRIFE